MRLLPIQQQVVVIMGASSGIGRATAMRFARKGARVVVAARSAEGLDSLVSHIRAHGGTAVAVVADVADPEQVKHVAERAIAEYGRLDTWAHVAAVAIWAPFEETRPEEWKHLLEVNLLGQVHGALAALPHLRKNGGALIHVSSVDARIAMPFTSAYVASKHGVAGFVDTLRIELRREGAPVSVTQILPAGIDTPLFSKALTRLGVEPRPNPPVYDPELVARAIVYAARHPVRELVVGGAGVVLLGLQRLAPRYLDAVLVRQAGFEAQLTNRRKSSSAPNNLFAPIPGGANVVRGDVPGKIHARSVLTSIQQGRIPRALGRVLGSLFGLRARLANAVYVRLFRRALVPGARRAKGPGSGLPPTVVAEARATRKP